MSRCFDVLVHRVRSEVQLPRGLRWITRSLLETIHERQLHEHGGASGVRDEVLLESALNRARNKFAYGEEDRTVRAAAYAFGLARNHAFVDGNKRTAFQAMYVFLGLNGYDLHVEEPEVVDVMNRLASGKLSEAAFAKWIGEHAAPVGR